jgi:hypothetical protein
MSHSTNTTPLTNACASAALNGSAPKPQRLALNTKPIYRRKPAMQCADCKRLRHAGECEKSKIKTVFVYPPIPVRNMDWQATRDDFDEPIYIGRGATEAAAIQDLIDQEEAE